MSKLFSEVVDQSVIVKFIDVILELSPRSNAGIVRSLIGVVENQGASPAEIADKLAGDRNNTAVADHIRLLCDLSYCVMRDSKEIVAKKHVFLTAKGAKKLGLKKR